MEVRHVTALLAVALLAAAARGVQSDRLLPAVAGDPPARCGALHMLTAHDSFPRHFSIYYAKVPKTASSTAGGVLRTVARHHGIMGFAADGLMAAKSSLGNGDGPHAPFISATHMRMGKLLKMRRDMGDGPHNSVIIASVRDPVERAMSEFYHFKVSRKNMEAGVEQKLQMLERSKNRMWAWLRGGAPGSGEDVPAAMSVVDVFFVQERMEESMLAFALRYGLPLRDILYVSSKNSTEGRPDDLKSGASYVAHPQLRDEPAEVREYAASAEYRESNRLDYEILQYANRHLDATIAAVPPPLWKAALRIYTRVLGEAQRRCAAPKGQKLKDCIWRDNGCAVSCLGELYASLLEEGKSACAGVPPGPWERTWCIHC